MTHNELTAILAPAQKSPGWNFREWPPQTATLDGGCELHVIPAALWRGRRCRRPQKPFELIQLRRKVG